MISAILNSKFVRRIRFGCECYRIVRDYCRTLANSSPSLGPEYGLQPDEARKAALDHFRKILRADTRINYNGNPRVLP